MSSSYGHAISSWDLEKERREGGGSTYMGLDCSSGLRCPEKRMRFSTLNKKDLMLGGDPIFYASYWYVTGRSGRTTRRDLYLCKTCGEKFADKHKLLLPGELVEMST